MARKRHSETTESAAEEKAESKATEKAERARGEFANGGIANGRTVTSIAKGGAYADGGLVAGRTVTSIAATSNPQPAHERKDHKMSAGMRASLKDYPGV